ncbi:MAG: S8 family serine peptidase [Bacteroidota bacterium]
MIRPLLCFLFISLFLIELPAQELPYATDRLIVSVRQDGLTKSASTYSFKDQSQANWLTSLGVRELESLAPVSKNPYMPVLLKFEGTMDVPAMVETLMASGQYEYVEPDYKGYGAGKMGTAPSDQLFERQWGLENDGSFDSKSVVDADIDMTDAWEITTGSRSIIVAILDSGIKPDHPEFRDRLWTNLWDVRGNNTDDDRNGYIDDFWGWDFVNEGDNDSEDNDPTDDHGHGTNVTGILAASGGNNIGYAGVDWNCQIMTLKILDDENSGFYSWWIKAIYYAVDNGANVINMSVGGASFSAGMEDAIQYAFQQKVPVVASMMNNNNDLDHYPASYKETIAVGATDTDNQRASPFFWSHTSGSNYGRHIDLVAPGNFMYGLAYNSDSNYETYWGGTSQSTPLVTGVISLMKSIDPELVVDEVRNLLKNGAVDEVGDPDEDTRGWDRFHGSGLLNAYNTLSFLATPTSVEEDLLASQAQIFPNPGSGMYQISFEENPLDWQMTLIDLSGREIKRWEQVPVRVALELDLPDGVYTMLFSHKQNATSFHKKLVHQQVR